MPKFKIVVEDTVTKLYQKEFEASSLDEARMLAEQEEWNRLQPDNRKVAAEGWTEIDGYSNAEIREDLTMEVL